MLTKVTRIKDYGIFRDFSWDASLPPFKKVNLFYGLNGSGKSTFSTLFYDIWKKELKRFAGYFKVEDDQLGNIESTILDSNSKNIYVFNSQFIQDNIGEYSNLKGIVYISEQNKEAKEALDILKKERERLKSTYTTLQTKYDAAEKAVDQANISAAKTIKGEFQFIGGAGVRFSNYNKTSFKNALDKYADFLKETIALTDIFKQIEVEKSLLKDDIKSKIELPTYNFDVRMTKELFSRTKELLSQTPKKYLKENISDEIFAWIEEGYRIHSSNICHYCGNIISPERKAFLDGVFNDEMQKLQAGLKESKAKWEELLLPEINIPESNLYTTKQSEFSACLKEYQALRTKVNSFIEMLVGKINIKSSNPFDGIDLDQSFNDIFFNISKVISNLTLVIMENNDLTESFETKQKESVYKIEKLLVYKEYIELKIPDLNTGLRQAAKKLKDHEVQQCVNQSQITERENELIDVIKASSNFNELLSKFLGRDELFLQYDEKSKGYRIKRKGSDNDAKHLSEGEKTAIAFIYFLTKVHENGNDITKSTIVFDDPISSFDSNHLFNAFSFIETYFEKCEQLFVLTHNFNFFKLLRKKYCKIAEMYLVQNSYMQKDGVSSRFAKIVTLPKSLKQASSEYCYLFEKIYRFYNEYSTTDSIEFNDYMQMSNTCRKVLESFASFKIQNVNDLSQKISGLYKCNRPDGYTLTDSEKMESEKIYRFVNAFSHESLFEDIGETDIVFGELHAVVGDILKLIERADKDHYNAQIKSFS
ncbi:MAG: AAA family ATPase [Candidatus Coproplasma sp.]